MFVNYLILQYNIIIFHILDIEIGLQSPSYSVDEGNGRVEVCVELLRGELERIASFTISTIATNDGIFLLL